MSGSISFASSTQKSLFGSKDVVAVTFPDKPKPFEFTKEVANVLIELKILEKDEKSNYKFASWVGEGDMVMFFEAAAKQNVFGHDQTLDKGEAMKLARMLIATKMDAALKALSPEILGKILIDYSVPVGDPGAEPDGIFSGNSYSAEGSYSLNYYDKDAKFSKFKSIHFNEEAFLALQAKGLFTREKNDVKQGENFNVNTVGDMVTAAKSGFFRGMGGRFLTVSEIQKIQVATVALQPGSTTPPAPVKEKKAESAPVAIESSKENVTSSPAIVPVIPTIQNEEKPSDTKVSTTTPPAAEQTAGTPAVGKNDEVAEKEKLLKKLGESMISGGAPRTMEEKTLKELQGIFDQKLAIQGKLINDIYIPSNAEQGIRDKFNAFKNKISSKTLLTPAECREAISLEAELKKSAIWQNFAVEASTLYGDMAVRMAPGVNVYKDGFTTSAMIADTLNTLTLASLAIPFVGEVALGARAAQITRGLSIANAAGDTYCAANGAISFYDAFRNSDYHGLALNGAMLATTVLGASSGFKNSGIVGENASALKGAHPPKQVTPKEHVIESPAKPASESTSLKPGGEASSPQPGEPIIVTKDSSVKPRVEEGKSEFCESEKVGGTKNQRSMDPTSAEEFSAKANALIRDGKLLPHEMAHEQMKRYCDALDKGIHQKGAVVDLRGLPAGKEVILVGDLHAEIGNLNGILNDSNNMQKLKDGNLIVVILGDAIHSERLGQLAEMESSVQIMQQIMQLKIDHPNQVYFTLGNHDSFTFPCQKGNVNQTLEYHTKVSELYGDSFIEKYTESIEKSPVLVIGDGFAGAHAGPAKGKISLSDIRAISPTDRTNEHLRQLQFGRFNESYFADDVPNFLENIGLKRTDRLIVGHTPQLILDPNGWHRELFPGHDIIFSARNNYGYALVHDGRIEFKTCCQNTPNHPPKRRWWSLRKTKGGDERPPKVQQPESLVGKPIKSQQENIYKVKLSAGQAYEVNMKKQNQPPQIILASGTGEKRLAIYRYDELPEPQRNILNPLSVKKTDYFIVDADTNTTHSFKALREKEEVVIGRANHDISDRFFLKENLSISNNHVSIKRKGNTIYIKDLKSTNGTWVETVYEEAFSK